jgi:hypothetical protein
MWFSLAAVTATILTYDIMQDPDSTILESNQNGINRDGLRQFLDQLDSEQWDPEDPNDLKKIIRMVLALGIPITIVAGILSMRPTDVDRMAQGDAPKGLHPWTVVSILKRVLRRII